jgi:membrane protease YdiL (CAAX protease family)
MVKVKNFFKDYKTFQNLENINIIIGFFLGTLLLGIFNIFPDQQANATVFMILLIVWGFTQLNERASKQGDKNIDVLGVGKSQDFLVAVVLGVVASLVLTIIFNVVIDPIFASTVSTSMILGSLYVLICAPFIEANFFRGLFMPMIGVFMRNLGFANKLLIGVVSIVGQASVFAWFHTTVFSGSQTLLIWMFVFGVIAGAGVYYSKSIGFEYGFHGANNLVAWLSGLI